MIYSPDDRFHSRVGRRLACCYSTLQYAVGVVLYGSIPYVDHKAIKEANPFTFNKLADIYASIVDQFGFHQCCLKHTVIVQTGIEAVSKCFISMC